MYAFKDERTRLYAELRERHEREIEHFDLHSLSMGLNLDETKEVIGDNRVGASSLSLTGSPSSNALRPKSAHR